MHTQPGQPSHVEAFLCESEIPALGLPDDTGDGMGEEKSPALEIQDLQQVANPNKNGIET